MLKFAVAVLAVGVSESVTVTVKFVVPEAVESLRPGDQISLTGLTLYTDDAGQAVRTWALTTAGQAGGTQ